MSRSYSKETTQTFYFTNELDESENDYSEYEVEVNKTIICTPGVFTLSNGDPGYPDEYEYEYDFNINDAPEWFNTDMLWDAIYSAENSGDF